MLCRLITIGICWLVLAAPAAAFAQPSPEEPSPEEPSPEEPSTEEPSTEEPSTEAQRIWVGVYLHDVTSFNQRDGIFDVDADIWVKWRGEFDPERVHVANAVRVDRVALGRDSDGSWHTARWRVRGTLRGEFPLERFPFDQQTLAIVLELPEQYGVLAPDLVASGMAPRFSITDWFYEPEFRPVATIVEFPSDLGHIAREGRSAFVSRVALEITISRPTLPVGMKLFLPLAIVACVVLLSLFLHPELTQPRITMGVTGLVACFAFQFSVSNLLPEVAYMTLADVVFMVVYFISVACVLATVVGHFLISRGMTNRALLMDRILRPTLPIVALAIALAFVPFPVASEAAPPDPVPEMPRTPSAKDTLRIGTTANLRVAGTAAGRGAYWSILEEDSSRGPQPVLVERVPNVGNDALRFLAGGEIEVTWRIRENAKWSDGTPITANDLVLPLDASPDEAIVSRTTPDERTVVLRWAERLSRALDAPRLWPSHVVDETLEAEGYDAARRMAVSGAPGIGPYRIVSHDDDCVVAEANPHFVGPAPNIARVEVIRYPDSAALARAFAAGEVDATEPNTVDVEHVQEAVAARPGSLEERPSSTLVMLVPNLDHPRLGQIAVRRAIAQAIDREHIAAEVYGTGARVAHVPNVGRTPEGAQIWPHDPEAARVVLMEPGGPIVLTHGPNAPRGLVARIAEDLRAVGLEVEIEQVSSTWDLWRERSHRGLLLHMMRADEDADVRRWWQLPSVDGRIQTNARNSVYTDDVHAVIEREARTLYPERRAQLHEALLIEWSRRLPSIPLVFAGERLLVDPQLRGWNVPGEPFGRGVDRWF
jgi:ABC-type transport system substrate-binding protein